MTVIKVIYVYNVYMDEVSQDSFFEPEKKEPTSEIKDVDISDEEDDSKMCKLEDHFWRDAYLKNATTTKHVIYCTGCTRLKFNDDGSVQQWLLDQGYVPPKDGSDKQVTDFGYGKI